MEVENLKKECRSMVGDVSINYTVSCDSSANAREAFAHIYKDGRMVGSANASNVTNAFGISFPNGSGLSWAEKQGVCAKIFEDLADDFGLVSE